MKRIAIVPARGGSKRLVKKNLRPLHGKPLVQYTLEAVANTAAFDRIVLSSDDPEILKVADQVKGVTPELRATDLARDKTKVIDLIKAIAARPEIQNEFDQIGLFLPTCPFRTTRHILGGLDLLDRDAFSVVSISEMKDPVQLSVTLGEDGVMNPNAIMDPSPLVTGATRSQDFDTVYRVNGGFYIAWIDEFVTKRNFFDGQVKGFVMEQSHVVDIDYEIDLKWAEYLLEHNLVTL